MNLIYRCLQDLMTLGLLGFVKFPPSQQGKTKISVALHTEPIFRFGVTFEQVISTVALSSLGIFHHVVGKFIHMP